LEWVDGLKAFAILGILLNHFVEEFGEGPWFSNPSYDWPPFSERISSIFPVGNNWMVVAVKFLGWLGDMGPGVFILLSGFTLALSQLRKEKSTLDFYRSRILRLFPLYIAIHIIVVAFAVLADFPAGFKASSLYVVLSFLGLRFNDALFFFINPSWWFIWLIIQFYLFFPILFKWLQNKKLVYFIGITLLITILSRMAGIFHITYSNNLYFWMTGLFAGTRLFEFSVGMALAKIISDKSEFKIAIPFKPFGILLISIGIYIFGFVSSWSYLGSLISNILITIGLSGIFYVFYNFGSSVKPVRETLLFIGRNSFSVFLIHQPFMQFASENLQGVPKIICLIAIIIIAFPVGYLIEKLVNLLVEKFRSKYQFFETVITGKLLILAIYTLTFVLILINLSSPILPYNFSKLSKLIAFVEIVAITLYFLANLNKQKRFVPSVFYLFFFLIFIFYFILPPDWIPMVAIVLTISFVLYKVLIFFIHLKLSLIFSCILTIVVLISIEQYFRINKPIEMGKWGEFPALRTDTNTAYSLIPDKSTHLKYNNYDYVLKTNSLGFASPEIDLRKNDPKIFRILLIGDAFTMPEGMEYAYSYPALLEKQLKIKFKDKKIEVINGGVTGYGPNEMRARMQLYIDTIKPDLVINELFVNEFDEINLTPDARLKDIGFTSEESTRIKYFGYSQLFLHYNNWIRGVSGIEDKPFNYYKSLLNLFEKSSPIYSDTVVSKMDSYFAEIKSLTEKNGAKLWIVYVPAQIEVSAAKYISYYPVHVNLADTNKFDFGISHRIINSLCEKNSIYLLDTKDLLKNHQIQPVYFEDSWHWNQNGHKLIADLLAREIEVLLNAKSNVSVN
jgi:peptidoglycan/LPS O-acetylase OafA/YrhL/lysophospholipase L1-like esterase